MMTLVCCTSNLLDGFLSENNLVLGETHQSFEDNHTIEEIFRDGEFHGYLFVHWID